MNSLSFRRSFFRNLSVSLIITFAFSLLITTIVGIIVNQQSPTSTSALPPTPTITWQGGTDSNWTTASNWDTGIIPAISDDVLIPSANVTLVIANDTDLEINSLTLTGNSILTIQSVNTGTILLPANPITTRLVVDTDIYLEDTSQITHPTNTANTTTPYQINLDIGGLLSIDTNAKIDVAGKGYASALAGNANPGSSGANNGACGYNSAVGGQYGGQGGQQGTCAVAASYGSFIAPTDLGSGGRGASGSSGGGGGNATPSSTAGGGAIRINADSVVLDGSIIADGLNNADGSTNTGSSFATGAGGSIYMTANQVSGAGNLQASGGNLTSSLVGGKYGPGGGGRIAVITTGVNSLMPSQYQATSGSRGVGGYANTLAGAAGTIYVVDSTAPQGILTVFNADRAAVDSSARTTVGSSSPYQFDELVITNGSRLNITGDLETGSYVFQGNYSLLNLSGSFSYTSSNDLIIDTNYFYLTVGSIVNTNTNLIVQNSSNSPSSTATGNQIVINSSQSLNSVDINNNSGVFTVTGALTVAQGIDIIGNSSTNTISGNLTVGEDLSLSGISANNINGIASVADDIIIADGTTTMCSVTATTSGSGAGLTTSLNTVNISATNLTLSGSAVLTHCTHTATTTNLSTININLSDTLSIASGAKIDTVGKGYTGTTAGNSNPGTSGGNNGACTVSGTSTGAVGGQYGGQGGAAGTCAANIAGPYGNFMAPVDLGSGGRATFASGGVSSTAGGGAVRINADVVVLDGVINTSGLDNTTAGSAGTNSSHAAGAGGAIYITAGQVSGSGNLIANGGSTTSAVSLVYGPGGGGRIAIITTGVNSLTTSQYQAASGSRGYGGYGGALAGAAGTIYTFNGSSTYGTLIIGNADHSAANSTAQTSTVPASLYQYDELVVIEGGRLNLSGDLEFTTYDFQGNYSALTVSGSLAYPTSHDLIIDTNNFYLTLGSLTDPDTNIIVQDSTNIPSNMSTGNRIAISSSQLLNSVDFNSNSGAFIVSGNLAVAEGLSIIGNSSTNTITGNIAVVDDIIISGNSSINTISGLVTATNFGIFGTSHNSTINNRLIIDDDVTLTDGTTTICSITASTSGSGTGLTTSLNTTNVDATNLYLYGTAILTHCTNTATATSLNTLNIELSNNLSIASGAKIDVVGKGYAGVLAPNGNPGNSGANNGACYVGGGAGAVGGQYGGQGGMSGSCTTAAGTYGDFMAPLDLGSGGRGTYGVSGGDGPLSTAGGGAVRINANSVTLNGIISASGLDNPNGYNDSRHSSSAGGGGAIYITASQISGTGSLQSNGGGTTSAISNGAYGPGGGGRIAVITTDANSLTTSQYSAVSGARGVGGYTGALAGAAGSIYIFDGSSTYGTLIIGNANHSAANSTAQTGVPTSAPLIEYDELVIIEGGRLSLTGDLEVTSYDFQGNYSALTVGGYFSYFTTNDLILDTDNFYLTLGSIANTNTNLVVKNSSNNPSYTATGNRVVINSSQSLNSIDVNNNSGIFTANGSLVATEDIIISGSSSTNTFSNNITAGGNLTLSGISANNINGIASVADDIIIADGTTTMCSVTATTSGSGAGLTTSLNTVNISATNLTLSGSAVLTHCTHTATTTNLSTININLSDTLSIASGAKIDTVGKGYTGTTAGNSNPGTSGGNNGACTVSGTSTGAVGGQYGGQGGAAGTCAANIAGPYGNFMAPVDLGSGGRATFASGGVSSTAGGGAVRINADVVVLDGVINTSGLDNTTAGSAGTNSSHAAGAGGAIYITAGQVSGSGNLIANGGSTTSAVSLVYGPGGGGRIAINNGVWISSIDANHGLLIGGNTVTITGGGFADGTGVIGPSGTGPTAFFFGGKPATNVVFLDEHTATMRVPAGDAPGEVDVVASNNNSDLDGITLTGNITVAAGTRAAGTGTSAEVGTIFMRNSLALSAYTYNDATMAIYLDDICAGVDGLVLSITPLPGGGAISNGSCTANVFSGDPNGYSLSISTDETTWDIAYPLQPIGDGTTSGILSNPIALTPGTIGFAFPTTQTNSTGLVSSNFNTTYPIVHSLASASHTNLYAQIPTLSSPLTIKTTNTTHPSGDFTTLIIGGNANMTIPTGEFSFTLLFSVVGN
ncbi:hypothetical protein FWF89_02235 [Candidatus Saccharibacteria bacterium]|nr:hypothetical protein [Candidatus Saccharibacteria bacterium]